MSRAAAIVLAALLMGVKSRAAEPLSFRTGILPILTKAGCNAGACHGAATGQGGFKLSLLGYDPEEDYSRITREFGGRRIQVAHPADSLLLRKPSGQLEHEGGRKLPRDSNGYATLRRWIASGAPYGSRDLQVKSISVVPGDWLFRNVDQSVHLLVTARLSDGSEQDVSAWALYTSNDESIAQVSKTGLVTTRGRGLTSIMVRYSGQVAAARVAVPLRDKQIAVPEFTPVNFIDEHIMAEWVRLHVPPSPLSDDAEFLRRVYLDITGRLPQAEEVRAFLASPATGTSRLLLVDALLSSDAFVDYWTHLFADLLLIHGQGDATVAYHAWLRDQIATHTPFDQMVRELLSSTGDTRKVGPANFMMLAQDPRDLSEHVGRMFLGTQIGCARCHAHPADRWTQEDYHRFAAFFARVTREGGVVRLASQGEVDDPKTAKPLSPRPLGAPAISLDPGADRRRILADWLTSADNRLFSRTLVNRVWKQLLGRGLVEPVDDIRPTNPATHPALLNALAADFAGHRFDLRHLIRTIVSSRTYQLSSRSMESNQADLRLYSHATLKPLPAAVFVDAVAQVTGVPDVFEGLPSGTRAVQLVSPATPSSALDVLGRCLRLRPCDGSAGTAGGLAASLHLINGSTINTKLVSGFVEALSKRSVREVVDELYCRAFARPPDMAERAEWEAMLARSENRIEAVQDLLWTLLNAREFALNH